MNTLPPSLAQTMQRASLLLQVRNFVAARALLEQIIISAPNFPEAQRLYAGALRALGDISGAERALRRAVAIDPNWAPAQTALGELLVETGRQDEGEIVLRKALAGRPPYPRAALVLARQLNRIARPKDALQVTCAFIDLPNIDTDLLEQHALGLTALDRYNEAIAIHRRIVAALPNSGSAELNLAGMLDSDRCFPEAVASAERAIKKGADTFAAQYILARALIGTEAYDEAEAKLRSLLHERPTFADAHGNLAQLIWMRTGDVDAASQLLNQTLQNHPNDDALHVHKAKLLDASGNSNAAYHALAVRARSLDASVELLLCASNITAKFDASHALDYARRAVALVPMELQVNIVLIDALLGVGDAASALEQIKTTLEIHPDNQRLIAQQTTAWRLLGDERYHLWCDYANMARGWMLNTPPGWSNLNAYLNDLTVSLHKLHKLHTHPLHQSLRHGSQTSRNLLHVEDAAVRGFFSAIEGPIQRHLEALGHGADPMRKRNRGSFRMKGIWSVRLQGGGYHINHVHPEGWLSSACYIELPRAITESAAFDTNPPAFAIGGQSPSRAGWLKFGEPGLPTSPPLGPEYFIQPEPGMLALFPSYFWHGTVPFDGGGTRLTIAFDLLPN